MVSSRWSYGPDGLRERPVVQKALLPRWRDLQPILLRSAGVVGLVATIMAVVSSDGLHLGSEDPAAMAAVEPAAPPEAALAAVLPAAPEIAIATPAAAEPIAPQPEVSPATSPAPILVTSVSIAPDPVPPPREIVNATNDTPPVDEPELVLEPVGVAAAEEGASVAPPSDAPAVMAAVQDPSSAAAIEQPTASDAEAPATLTSELRSETPTAPPVSEVASTASVAPSAPAMASLSPHANDGPAAEISLSALRPTDLAPAASDRDRFAWPNGAANCPRDWVEAEGSRDDASADCTSTDVLIASIADDEHPALEEAAAAEATVLALLPRIPLPRPEPPADFKPSNPHQTVRVNSRNSSWPPDPPPNCAAGQHAKWRFVDRRAGTKEWYCR